MKDNEQDVQVFVQNHAFMTSYVLLYLNKVLC